MIRISLNEKLRKGLLFTVKKISEVLFEINPEGFTLAAMDVSRCCMVYIKLEASEFDIFECEKEETFQVNLEDFKKVLPKIRGYEEVIMTLGDGVDFMCKNKNMKKPRVIGLKKYDIDLDELKMEGLLEQIDNSNRINLKVDLIKEFVDLAELYGDRFHMSISNEEICLDLEDNMGSIDFPIEKDEWESSEILSEFEEKTEYRVSDLKMVKEFQDTVDLYAAQNCPMFLKWEYIIFITSPFIDQGDDPYSK